MCSLLVPYPGTALFDRMKRDGRIVTEDWSQYTSDEVVFKPRQLTPEQLRRGHDWVGQQFHSWSSMLRRWWKTGLFNPPIYWLINFANRRYFNFFPRVDGDPGKALPGPEPEPMLVPEPMLAPDEGPRRLPVLPS